MAKIVDDKKVSTVDDGREIILQPSAEIMPRFYRSGKIKSLPSGRKLNDGLSAAGLRHALGFRPALVHLSRLSVPRLFGGMREPAGARGARHALGLRDGCTMTMLLARGVKIETIDELLAAGLAIKKSELVGRGRPVEITPGR
jgi:hypothetical protein